jgi:hypothetical protein
MNLFRIAIDGTCVRIKSWQVLREEETANDRTTSVT